MGKYLVSASYNAEGMKGVIAKGGVARREAVEKMLTDVGGTVESFHFAFGADDVFTIVDVPDNISAAALGMAVAASGLVSLRMTVLLTPEEIDLAAQRVPGYTPPGG